MLHNSEIINAANLQERVIIAIPVKITVAIA